MRIKTQRETFAYRLADMSTPFVIGDSAGGRGDGGGGRGGGNKAEPSPAAPDASTPRGTLSGPWTSNPDKWNDMAEAENNRSGPKVPKRVIVPGAGGSGGGGGGSNTARPGGGGSSAVGAGGIMDVSRPLHDLIKQKYPDVEIGGHRVDGSGMPDEHQRGAIDIMHPYNHGIDPNWAIEEGFKAGAPWAIWDNQMYYPGGRTEPYNVLPGMPNDATQRHEDHIHIGPLIN